jgi:hypothetical protein
MDEGVDSSYYFVPTKDVEKELATQRFDIKTDRRDVEHRIEFDLSKAETETYMGPPVSWGIIFMKVLVFSCLILWMFV